MTTVDQIFQAIQRLPTTEKRRIFERLAHALAEPAVAAEADQAPLPEPPALLLPLIGEPDLWDEVCAMAMEARQRDKLRIWDDRTDESAD